uniref:DPPIV_N domain-containing protein n=1 Tax=Caenorhabditis tropicalis TaxID=1561998 RepID=A0A1I7UPG6_9PELO
MGSSNNNNYQNDVLTTPLPLPTPPAPPTPPPSAPYLIAYVLKTTSEFYDFHVSNLTSLTPENVGYTWQNRLLGWSQDSKSLITFDPNTGKFNSTQLDIATWLCSTCRILKIRDDVDVLKSSDIVYCCSDCISGSYHCSVNGFHFQVSDDPCEIQVEKSSDLYMVTWQYSTCTLQTTTFNGTDGSVKIGETSSCPNTTTPTALLNPIRNLVTSSKVLTRAFGETWQMDTVISERGDLVLFDRFQNLTNVIYFGMYSNGTTMEKDPMIISTRIDESIEHRLIAIIYPTRFYITRQNLQSGCVTTLSGPGYVEYRFDGSFGGGAWIGDDLMLWYSDRGGANIATFQFDFPSDLSCSPQKPY